MSLYADYQLPAVGSLASEGIEVNDSNKAPRGAIRIGVLNLMPLKIPTESDILRVFSTTEHPLLFTFHTMASHVSRNTPKEHIDRFYTHLNQESIANIDCLLITGAPLEMIDYEDVNYYKEFDGILTICESMGKPVLLLCWAAFAGLYRRFGIDRTILSKKISGVFPHIVNSPRHPIMSGVSDMFYAPQSRFITIECDRLPSTGLVIVASSPETGVHIASLPNCQEVYITGHGEYARDTLSTEYYRDIGRGLNPSVPRNYFVDDNPEGQIIERWQSDGRRIFSNWISQIVVPRMPAIDCR